MKTFLIILAVLFTIVSASLSGLYSGVAINDLSKASKAKKAAIEEMKAEGFNENDIQKELDSYGSDKSSELKLIGVAFGITCLLSLTALIIFFMKKSNLIYKASIGLAIVSIIVIFFNLNDRISREMAIIVAITACLQAFSIIAVEKKRTTPLIKVNI